MRDILNLFKLRIGVAIALATRRYVERHLDGCAVMRCLGATQGRLLALHGATFLLLGIAACTLGCAIGFVAQGAIAAALGELLRAALPAPSLLPALQGFLVGVVLLLGFALPPLLQLKNVPAVRVMRRESGAPRGGVLGKVTAVGEQFLTVEVSDGVTVKVQRHSISAVLPKDTIKHA